MDPCSSPPASRPRIALPFGPLAFCSLLALLAYGVLLHRHFGAVAAGADSGGYYLEARLLTEGKVSAPMRTIPELNPPDRWSFTPLGTIGDEACTKLSPTYPPGLPLHYALFGSVGGWKTGIRYFGVGIALAAIVLVYGLLRQLGLTAAMAAAGATALAVCPQFLFVSLVPLSDTVATAWCTAAVLAALRGARDGRWAAGAGAAFGLAVLVRPANAILLPTLLVLLWGWRGLLGAALGGLPAAGFLAWYNYRLYGHPLASGYGDVFGSEMLFQREVIGPTLRHYAEWLPRLLPLGLGLVLAPFLPWRQRPRELTALWLWWLAFAGFYACYYFTHTTWWFLRFVLPAFPALIALSAWSIEGALIRLSSRVAQPLPAYGAAVVFVVSLALGLYWNARQHVLLMGAYQQPYRDVSYWVERHTPTGALIATRQCSSAIFFYTDRPILRWDCTPAERFGRLREGLRQSGRPCYAVLFPHEVEEGAIAERMPGTWERVTEVSGIGIWKLEPGAGGPGRAEPGAPPPSGRR